MGAGSGIGGDDRIALLIETDADLTALRASRAEVRGLGSDTAAAASQAAAAAATQATGNQTLTVSQEQMQAALAATNGDLMAAGRLLAQTTGATAPLAAATAQLAATETQAAAAIGATTAATAAQTRAMGLAQIAAIEEDKARSAALNTVTKIPPSMRTAANAVGIMSQAAMTGSGSMAGLATAAGGVAMGISQMSASASVAASASGIGALITVAVVLYEVFKKAKEEVGATANQLAHIGNLSEAQIPAALQQAAAARDAAVAKAAASATGTILDLIPTTQANKDQKRAEELIHAYDELVKRSAQFRMAESARLAEGAIRGREEIANSERSLALERAKVSALTAIQQISGINVATATDAELSRIVRFKSEYQQRLDQIEVEKQNNAAAIRASFERFDATGKLLELGEQERRQMEQKVALSNEQAAIQRALAIDAAQVAAKQYELQTKQGSNRPDIAAEARLEQIELERILEIRKTGDVLAATERAEQQKRKLYWDTAMTTAASLKSIADLTANSENSRTKALHNFAKNYRAVIIGAKAAEAAVDSAKAFASVPAHLAVQDYSGAALAALAGTQLAAAAALGFAEAGGGGGGGGSGGGGGGGGGGNSGTFQPQGASGQGGAQVINLYTMNPYSKDAISVVSYELGRAGVLKRPIALPPTSGLFGEGG